MPDSTTAQPRFAHGAPLDPASVDEREADGLCCNACKLGDVEVTHYEERVHPHSGDRYVDLEVRCRRCGRYSQRAWADN